MAAESEFSSADLSRSLSRSFALHVASRLLEALALGWLAAAIVLACLSLGPEGARGIHVWIAASIAAVCTVSATWIEHAPKPRDHVRAVDRRLGWNGALVTAADVAADAGGGTLARALVRSVGSRLRTTDLARASLPSTPLALAAVLLGVAVVYGARDLAEHRHASDEALFPPSLSMNDRAALAAAARLTGDGDAPADRPTIGASVGARLELASALDRAANAGAIGPEERKELEQRLGDRLVDADIGERERAVLTQALSVLQAAHGPGALAVEANPTTKGGTAGDPAASALASRDPLGRMSGPDPRTVSSIEDPTLGAGPDDAERGVGPLRWWPARHDAVVEAWLASTSRPK